jgi:hypothetical protein
MGMYALFALEGDRDDGDANGTADAMERSYLDGAFDTRLSRVSV